MLRQLVYIYLMSLPPEFVYQGVLPDCFSQITDWFVPLPDLSSLLATNSLFAASFQLLSISFLFVWAARRCTLSLLMWPLWPFTCWYCCFNRILCLSSGFVSFVCHPMDLWQFALLCFQSLVLSSLANAEKGILFKWGISALKLKLCKDLGNWISGTWNYWVCSLLYGSGPIMRYYFPAFAFLWAVAACSLERL